MPLELGVAATQEGGRWGMALAIGFVWLLGHQACARFEKFGPVMTAGSFLVALSQCYPVLHLMAGYLSLQCMSRAGMGVKRFSVLSYGLTEVGGFVTTLLTGGPLLVAAGLCGLGFRAFLHLGHDDGHPL